MDKDILSTLINHLDSSGFDDLIFYLLKQEDDFYLSKRLSHIDDSKRSSSRSNGSYSAAPLFSK